MAKDNSELIDVNSDVKDRVMEVSHIQSLIYVIRGKQVMLDSDLAILYQVETKTFNQAVKRNIERFPSEFMFKLNDDEFKELIANCDRFKTLKHSPTTPYAFTDYGVAMLSSVLKSQRAININIQIMKTFVKMKQYAIEHKDLSQRIDELENYIMTYAKENNQEIERINQALNYLIDVTKPSQIGFKIE